MNNYISKVAISFFSTFLVASLLIIYKYIDFEAKINHGEDFAETFAGMAACSLVASMLASAMVSRGLPHIILTAQLFSMIAFGFVRCVILN